MTERYYIGWVRDEKGKVISRPKRTICNAITSLTGGGMWEKTDLATLHRI